MSSGYKHFWPFPFLQAWTHSFPHAWVMVELVSASRPRSFPSSDIIHSSSLSLFPWDITGNGITSFQKSNCLCLLPTPPTQKTLPQFSIKSPGFSFHGSLRLLANSAIAAVHGSSSTFVCFYIFQLFPQSQFITNSFCPA